MAARTDWKSRATEAEARLPELEKAAQRWKALATQWRTQYHELLDRTTLDASTVLIPEEAEDEPR